MPRLRLPDKDEMIAWRRLLEKGRLEQLLAAGANDSLSGPGEGLPGPGAAAASAIHRTPPAAGGGPEDWGRQLERDRLSMHAVSSETNYPGPGALGGALGELAGELKPNDKLAALKDPAAAAQAMKEALEEMKKNWPIIESRGRLWQIGYASQGILMFVPMLVVPFHKIMYDARVKDTVIKLKTAVRKTGIPLPPQAELLIKIAPWLPSIEWLILLVLWGILTFFCTLILVMIGFLGCGFAITTCGKDLAWEIGASAVNLFKSIIF